MVAASITIIGGLLALALDRDGGPRSGASNLRTNDQTDPTVIAEAGVYQNDVDQGLRSPNLVARPLVDTPARRIIESTPLRNPTADAPLPEAYGAVSFSAPTAEQPEPRLGVPLGERTWTISSVISGNSGYGEPYRSRFGHGFRHHFSTASLLSAAARRHMGDEGLGDMYAADGPEPRLAERMLIGVY